MDLQYVLLATEGTHDQAVLCRLLQLQGLKAFAGERTSLNEDSFKFWKRLVPEASANIYKRIDIQMPRIFTSSTHSVAVYQGAGSNLLWRLDNILDNYEEYAQEIHAFGLIVDADNHQPNAVAEECSKKLRHFFPTIPNRAGTIHVGPPRTGIYVLPDNKRPGTLESILVDCATTIYPDHKLGAEHYLDRAHKAHWKPFDREKAVVSTIVSVIQPGIASHLSLGRAKDKWICETTEQAVPEVARLKQFLVDLLALS